jgi:hypothetical protein
LPGGFRHGWRCRMQFQPLQKGAGHGCENILDPLVQPKGGLDPACHSVKSKMPNPWEQGRVLLQEVG